MPGNYKVAIAVKEISIPAEPEACPALIASPRQISPVANSGLTAEVKPGRNTFNFALVSDGGN